MLFSLPGVEEGTLGWLQAGWLAGAGHQQEQQCGGPPQDPVVPQVVVPQDPVVPQVVVPHEVLCRLAGHGPLQPSPCMMHHVVHSHARLALQEQMHVCDVLSLFPYAEYI